MVLREQDKHFLWSLWMGSGMIFVWRGIWEGIYEVPYIGKEGAAEWVALFLGLTILTLSGLIFKNFDPLGSFEKSIHDKLRYIMSRADNAQYKILYQDKSQKDPLSFSAADIQELEKSTLIMHKKGKQEVFIPTHRISEILYQGKSYWKF